MQVVDGQKISLSRTKPAGANKLYFINLGGYADGQVTQRYKNIFPIATTAQAAKSQAKTALRQKLPEHLHTDDLHDVDDCLELQMIGAYHIVFEPLSKMMPLVPVNGYHIIPKAAVHGFMNRRGR